MRDLTPEEADAVAEQAIHNAYEVARLYAQMAGYQSYCVPVTVLHETIVGALRVATGYIDRLTGRAHRMVMMFDGAPLHLRNARLDDRLDAVALDAWAVELMQGKVGVGLCGVEQTLQVMIDERSRMKARAQTFAHLGMVDPLFTPDLTHGQSPDESGTSETPHPPR